MQPTYDAYHGYRHYWNLTEHIFRYDHWNMSGQKALSGAHTVNEHMRVEDFVGMIRCVERIFLYYMTLIIIKVLHGPHPKRGRGGAVSWLSVNR